MYCNKIFFIYVFQNHIMRKISILISLIVASLFTYAQDTLHFTNNNYPEPPTPQGDTITISDTLYNSGPSTFFGPITFNSAVNDSLISDSTIIYATPANSFTSSDSFVPNQNYPVAFHIVNNGSLFVVGLNGVVIWPVYSNNFSGHKPGYVGPNDSVRITTYYYPLGIASSPLAKMYIYETPAQLNINFGDAENIVQQVRIYNIIGQGVYSGSADRSKDIPTAGWVSGVYLCEITTLSGDKRTFKFRVE
jgi:hypothetical protein